MIQKVKNFGQEIWSNKIKRYILFGVLVLITILILIIIIIVVKSSNSDYVKPNCKGVCKNPYNIKVYSDKKLKKQLKKCGYNQNSELFNFILAATKKHNIYRACHNAQPLLPNCEIMENISKLCRNYAKWAFGY